LFARNFSRTHNLYFEDVQIPLDLFFCILRLCRPEVLELFTLSIYLLLKFISCLPLSPFVSFFCVKKRKLLFEIVYFIILTSIKMNFKRLEAVMSSGQMPE
jgi:hypothetical protein